MSTVIGRSNAFDPQRWLEALTEIGGGYALMSGGKLALVVDACDGELLARVMEQLVGHSDRQEAVKTAIARRQNGEVEG